VVAPVATSTALILSVLGPPGVLDPPGVLAPPESRDDPQERARIRRAQLPSALRTDGPPSVCCGGR